MAEEVTDMEKENWMNAKWRPAMGWMYMIVCSFDFVVAPILWSILNTITGGSTAQWDPLTLRGAGLFHIAMGAVLGISALGRTQEKLAGANNGGLSLPTTPTSTPPAASTGFNSNFSAPPTVPAAVVPAPTLSSTGKKVVPTAPDPIL